MSHDTSPGNLARVPCSRCRQVTFFVAKGGPHLLPCPTCGHLIRIEMVHDGLKWRIKDLQTTRRQVDAPGSR